MTHLSEFARPHRFTAPTDALRPFIARLVHSLQVARERKALRQLDATRLEDLGISREAAFEEARRPFWDAPAHWRRPL